MPFVFVDVAVRRPARPTQAAAWPSGRCHAIGLRPALTRCAIASLAALPALAHAQAVTVPPSPVVVTAARDAQRASALISEVSVVDRTTLDQLAGLTLAQVLSRLPGLQFSSNGGPGKTASIFIRGLEARHTLLLVDGMRLGSATVGSPSLDNLPLESVDRIEVVRGPMSGLYGSDAVGGVVQIFTRRGGQGLQPNLKFEAGSHQHALAAGGVRWGSGPLDVAAQVQRTGSLGPSATNPWAQFGSHNADRDGFRQDGGHLRLGWQLAPGWRLQAMAMESSGRTGYDDGPGVDAQAGLHNSVRTLQLEGTVLPGWQTQVGVSRSVDAYDTLSSASAFATLGTVATRQTQLAWENRIATRAGSLLLLAERLEQTVSRAGQPFVLSERQINALALGLSGGDGPHRWQGSLRHDRNSQFGRQTTGALGYGYELAPGWLAAGSYGQAFVAPSFNQLYFPNFGNPKLLPETSKQAEASLRWTRAEHSLRAALFQYRLRGYITAGANPSNLPQAQVDGLGLNYEGQFQSLKLGASLEHLDGRNTTAGNANAGKALPRRASQTFKLQADQYWGPFSLGASLQAFSHRFDNVANTLRLGGYGTLDLRAEWALRPDLRLGLRVNNLADKAYETAYGYRQPGREGFVTLRWEPK